MDRETFNRWLASYGSAWTGRDPGAAASLYADDATYQVTPMERSSSICLNPKTCGLGNDYWTVWTPTNQVTIASEQVTIRELGIAARNFQGPITALPPRVWRHQVLRAIVGHELAVVLAAVLDGEHPGVGIVD